MKLPTKQSLAAVKELCRLFRIEHEDTDQPFIFAHMDDVRPLVEGLLVQKAGFRDSDSRLYYEILTLLGFNPKTMSVFELLKGIHYGEIPHWEAVSRVKRETQLAHPDLRGKIWQAVIDVEAAKELPFEGDDNP